MVTYIWDQAFAGTNADLSSKVFCGIHLMVISKEMRINFIRNMYWGVTLLKLLPHLPGSNKLVD